MPGEVNTRTRGRGEAHHRSRQQPCNPSFLSVCKHLMEWAHTTEEQCALCLPSAASQSHAAWLSEPLSCLLCLSAGSFTCHLPLTKPIPSTHEYWINHTNTVSSISFYQCAGAKNHWRTWEKKEALESLKNSMCLISHRSFQKGRQEGCFYSGQNMLRICSNICCSSYYSGNQNLL